MTREQPGKAPMDDEKIEILDALQAALDGTCLHEWDLNASAARGGLIATHPNGTRWAIQVDAWRIEP